MKDMLSKGHYCYKIHASLMKNSTAPPPPPPPPPPPGGGYLQFLH